MNIIRTQAELDNFVSLVSASEPELISIDIESNERFDDEHWNGLQMSIHGIGVYAGGDFKAYILYSYSMDWVLFSSMLEAYPVVMHNAKFDMPILHRHGVLKTLDIKFHDTMIMSYVQNESRMSHGLKNLARDILGKDDVTKFGDSSNAKPVRRTQLSLFDDDESLEAEYQEAMAVWLQNFATYCIDDCINTYELYHRFKPRLESADGLRKVYEDLDIPLTRIVMDMEGRGVFLDKPYLANMEIEAKKEIVELEAKIYELVGRKFDIGSVQQLSKILYEELSIGGATYSDKGNVVLDAEALKKIASKEVQQEITEADKKSYLKYYGEELSEEIFNTHRDKTLKGKEIATAVLRYREMQKLHSTYIVGISKLAIGDYIHCSRNIIGTRTGRMSCSQPNLQNVGRRADSYNIRKAFKPREGYCFVQADRSQLELRILAHFSQDEGLMQAFNSGLDIHQNTADKVGCTRQIAKSVNFGLCYGQGAKGLSENTGISMDEAQSFIDKYFEMFPKVRDFMAASVEKVKRLGYIQTITKRRRNFENYNRLPLPKGVSDIKQLSEYDQQRVKREMFRNNKGIERQSNNSTIQGSGGDLSKIAIKKIRTEIKEKGLDAHILFQIHDEIIVECKDDIKEQVLEIVQRNMEHPIPLRGVPLVAEPKIMYEWEK